MGSRYVKMKKANKEAREAKKIGIEQYNVQYPDDDDVDEDDEEDENENEEEA